MHSPLKVHKTERLVPGRTVLASFCKLLVWAILQVRRCIRHTQLPSLLGGQHVLGAQEVVHQDRHNGAAARNML